MMSSNDEDKEYPWKVQEILTISFPGGSIGSFSDLRLVCSNGAIIAHRAVLGPASPLLLSFFSSDDQLPTVMIPDYGVEDIKCLLNILYTGEATCSKFQADQLLSLTKTLKLDPIPISYSSLRKNLEELLPEKNNRIKKIKYGDQGVRNVVKKEMDVELVQRVLAKTVDKESVLEEGSFGFQNNYRASSTDLKLCYICKAVIRGHNIFLEHLRLHREEGGPYDCQHVVCTHKAKTGLLLHRHFVETHVDDVSERDQVNLEVEKYKCDMCCLKWTNFSNFKKHMNAVHNIRPLKCHFCEQRFNDRLGLKTHVQAKHIPGKNYSCDVCLKKFKTARFLYHHRRQIHELGESRVAKCDTCGFVSKGMANLKKHIKTVHDTESIRHQCSYCPSMFKSKFNLTCHERTHSGESPYSCHFCNAKFKRAHHLKGHEQICKKNSGVAAAFKDVGTSTVQTQSDKLIE